MRRALVIAAIVASATIAAPTPASADCVRPGGVDPCRVVCLVYPRFCTIA